MYPDRPHDDAVARARKLYNKLRPGQEVQVAAMLLEEPSISWVLDGIVGSAFQYGYLKPGARPDRFKDWTLFRLKEPLTDGRRSFVSEDSRHLYNLETYTGIYTPKPQ